MIAHSDHVFLLPSAAHSDNPHLLDGAICFMPAIEMVIESIQKKLK